MALTHRGKLNILLAERNHKIHCATLLAGSESVLGVRVHGSWTVIWKKECVGLWDSLTLPQFLAHSETKRIILYGSVVMFMKRKELLILLVGDFFRSVARFLKSFSRRLPSRNSPSPWTSPLVHEWLPTRGPFLHTPSIVVLNGSAPF